MKLILLLTLLCTTSLFASESRMIGLGESGATGSFLLSDYRNLYRNPSEDVGTFAVTEFGEKSVGVFFETDGLIPQVGIMMGHDNGIDLFAANDFIGARLSGKRADGHIYLGLGLGVTVDGATAFANWQDMAGGDSWNVGASYTLKRFVFFGEYIDTGSDDVEDNWFAGFGRVWELTPAMILKTSLVYTDDTDLTAGIGLQYELNKNFEVFGSATQSLREAEETKVSLGAAARYKQFLVEGLLGTSALLDTDEMFTSASITMFF